MHPRSWTCEHTFTVLCVCLQVVIRTVERLQREEDWRATSDSRRALRVAERASQEREAIDRQLDWSVQQVINRDKRTKEFLDMQVSWVLWLFLQL